MKTKSKSKQVIIVKEVSKIIKPSNTFFLVYEWTIFYKLFYS